MVVASSVAASEAHRLIAFIFFTCAEADADWQSEETFALYGLLERHAGGLSRQDSVALAQEAYQRWLALPDADARLAVIDAEAPGALGHLSHPQRDELFADLIRLIRSDGEVSRGEGALATRVHRLLREAPVRPDTSVRDDEIRLLAFIYFTFAAADGDWQSEETIALYDALERHAGPGAREHTIAVAQAAYRTFQATPAAARVDWIAARVEATLAARDAAARKQILHDLVGQARADGKFTPAEGHVLEDIRELLLGPATLDA